MQAVTSFFSSFGYAFQLIIKKKLFLYFIPAIIISFLFYYLFSGGQSIGSSLSFMEDWWLIGWIISASKSIFSFLAFMIFEFIVLVLLSPVNAYLAEQAREDITGEKLAFSMEIFLRALGRMLVILVTAFFAQLLLGLLLWFLSFFLGDRFFEIGSMLNIAFFIGFSFFDFGLELDDVNAKNSRKFARKNWVACILLGLAFNVGIYYPQAHGLFILYLVAISFLPNLLTIMATRMYYDIKKGDQVTRETENQL